MYRKNERVKWIGADGKEAHGTVLRGGAKSIKALQDGGETVVSGPPYLFEVSTVPAPTCADSDGPMAEYSVRGVRMLRGHDGNMLTAKLYKGSVHIANIENSGTGGSNMYLPVTSRADLQKAEEAATEWSKVNGLDDPIEALDLWVEWYHMDRPIGRSAKTYLHEIATMIEI